MCRAKNGRRGSSSGHRTANAREVNPWFVLLALEKAFDRQLQLRESERRDGIVQLGVRVVAVFAGAGATVHFDPPMGDIDDPIVRDPSSRIQFRLFAKIVAERAVGNFDQQQYLARMPSCGIQPR